MYADLDVQCFQNRINLSSAGHGLMLEVFSLNTHTRGIRKMLQIIRKMAMMSCIKLPVCSINSLVHKIFVIIALLNGHFPIIPL